MYTTTGLVIGARPVYGLTSGLGWPMPYRLSSVLAPVICPVCTASAASGGMVWVPSGGDGARLAGARNMAGLCAHGFKNAFFLPPLFLIAPYVTEDFRYGNAQFFIVAMANGALPRPAAAVLAGGSLALAISSGMAALLCPLYLAVRRIEDGRLHPDLGVWGSFPHSISV